ncbi:DUF4253 domain-containing protein [Tsukamurella sp. 8F]|uniref:DUF4253 domain-containing protein n=1 Tax=unclassified Tsukamurella TaxID=2633480 RepID=UPI0023B94463|nr:MULTISPECIES: DUF4253 domain-containing protein [unclassified Tsukamurella]MDF0532219.1 DUF4253 domain-containing protein [Tsukamurella sp. 8J]MDF0588076.1 DUF4253 domain-containing protein [Tsukamurella sp. 8F]
MFQSTAGTLPTDGTPTIAGVQLPKGRRITATGADQPSQVAWVSDDILPVDQLEPLVRKLAAAFPDTGLWPLRARGLDDDDLSRPWHDGELDGADPRQGLQALAVLSRPLEAGDDEEEWEEAQSDDPEPALTLADPLPGPDLTADQLEIDHPGGLLLVPVARPADVAAAIGWAGTVNAGLGGGELTAVLRSWEERFGGVLVGLGFDTMTVQIARLPQGANEIQAILREHHAFCADNIDQGLPADQYAEGLAEWIHWDFWWD